MIAEKMLEIRNPKFETNSNDQKRLNTKRARFEFRFLVLSF